MHFTVYNGRYKSTSKIKKNYGYLHSMKNTNQIKLYINIVCTSRLLVLRREIGFKQMCFQSRFKDVYTWS